MKTFIRSTGIISAQNTFGQSSIPSALLAHVGNRLRCKEPDYSSFIDAKSIRRMSRIIRMGVAAAMECLQKGACPSPDAIITGTAYGCLEDTGIFLTKMVQYEEELLTPTAFIQSTHNTVGAQIALILKCHGYNNTFVSRGFSFESALLDAGMLLRENKLNHILVGAVDEITDQSHAILSRFGLYKSHEISNLDLFSGESRGTINGEGASFFLLSNQAGSNNIAVLDGVNTFYKPENAFTIKNNINSFLRANGMGIGDIDLIISGRNGDKKGDKIYDLLEQELFGGKTVMPYKHLCGEFPTATAFGLWLAAALLRNGLVPDWIKEVQERKGEPLRHILIYNHYLQIHHSLFLVSAC
jgi:3-oxoacyl-[acyl-carrier-protein] synthase II